MSPEIAIGDSYGKEVDIWAFGCFAFELLTGSPPFHQFVNNLNDLNPLYDAICFEPVPRVPAKWSNVMNDFVHKCLHKDKLQRWNIDQLLGHPLFINVEACKEGWIADFARQ